MTYARVKTLSLPNSWEARSITVEAAVRKGLPRFQITGITGARERADRIRQALRSTGVAVPYAAMLVNLAPVDLVKRGGYFDLSIAAGLLLALVEPPPGSLLALARSGELYLVGELSLSGALCPLDRALPFLRGALRLGARRLVLPWANGAEAGLVPDLDCIPLRHLSQLLEPPPNLRDRSTGAIAPPPGAFGSEQAPGSVSLAPEREPVRVVELHGVRPELETNGLLLTARQKRALSVAAAGRHSILFIGPPGSGKTSMARLLPALAAPPDREECLDILTLDRNAPAAAADALRLARPFRQPHHSVTDGALIGGGRPLGPGEITLAHHGLLLLDELTEFSRTTLQNLREPLEEGRIRLHRGSEEAEFPARFQLAATANPCPCGYTSFARCSCSTLEKQRYLSRLLGPLRDRIDMEILVGDEPQGAGRESPGADWIAEVERAQRRQAERFAGGPYRFNADVARADLERYCGVKELEQDPDYELVRRGAGSFRRWDRIRRLARTVADLEGAAEIRPSDLLEAFSYRCLDEIWKENP